MLRRPFWLYLDVIFYETLVRYMKLIEKYSGNSLIAFNVSFHGYERLPSLILILFRHNDVSNLVFLMFSSCAFLTSIHNIIPIHLNGAKQSP